MWNCPRPNIELVSLVLAGEFLSTVPPGKSMVLFLITPPPKLFGMENRAWKIQPPVLAIHCNSSGTSTSVNWKGRGSIVIKCYIFKENYFRSNNWILLAH